jgi:glutaredoxin-related protein
MQESRYIKQTLNDLTVRVDKLSKAIENIHGKKKECSEWKINEKPLAYVAGAFVGGVIVGYMMSRGKGCFSKV